MNKKVLIVCVNYNSYDSMDVYLKSIEKAASICDSCDVDIIIADNSTKPQNITVSKYNYIKVSLQKYNNLGYFGAAQNVINNIGSIDEYDTVVISNVDLIISEGFFNSFSTLNIDGDVAWIAPRIWSNEEKRDRNPKTLHRKSRKRLLAVRRMYKHPVLEWLYTHTMYKRKRMYAEHPECDLFAGHGSFIMLTRSFFRAYPEINYPVFLFGEESYLGELIRKAKMRVRYIPSIVVYDSEHVSTGKMDRKLYCKYNIEAINYILDTFYEQD